MLKQLSEILVFLLPKTKFLVNFDFLGLQALLKSKVLRPVLLVWSAKREDLHKPSFSGQFEWTNKLTVTILEHFF